MQRLGKSYLVDTRLFKVLAALILMIIQMQYNSLVLARECKAQAELVTDFHLCESTHNGKHQLYSCRDYRQDGTLYRVFYKGGKKPKAMAAVVKQNGSVTLSWLKETQLGFSDCNVAPPEGIPRDVIYLGSGVCEDAQQQAVPCSLYRQASARQTRIYHYMVFYPEGGNGITSIDKQSMGSNQGRAFAAEFAYQLGLRLLESNCCHENAIDYLAHAHQLFPREEVYRETYYRHLQDTAFMKQSVPYIEIDGEEIRIQEAADIK